MDLMTSKPKIQMSELYDFIKKNNKNGEFDHVKNYLDDLNVYKEGADDLFKFLANSRRRNQFPELFDYLENNHITDPEDILDFLRKHN